MKPLEVRLGEDLHGGKARECAALPRHKGGAAECRRGNGQAAGDIAAPEILPNDATTLASELRRGEKLGEERGELERVEISKHATSVPPTPGRLGLHSGRRRS